MSGPVAFLDAFRVWARIGLLSFGGPAGQIGLMHRILVEERRWISERRFLHALNYCMLLPGPEAMQLATYVGWLLHGVRGGLVAGALFVLPGFVAILGLSIAYALFADTTWLAALFFGIKAAVLAIVVTALVRIARRALRRAAMWGIAGAAFVAIFFLAVPFPFIVLGAGVLGWLGGRLGWVQPAASHEAEADGGVAPLLPDTALPHERPDRRRTLATIAVWGLVWWVPVAVLALLLGVQSVYVQEGWFFSKAAVVTFGGAYAVLAYVAQRAVEDFGWLRPGEMLDGLGMAESTPGPLIMVVQFVGFMGAYRDPGPFDPLVAGILASLVVTWVTFVPCFLWIFAGAPYIEHLRGRKGLSHALGGITAAVVGVILNLVVWFGIHVLFASVDERRMGPLRLLLPDVATVDLAAVVLVAVAFALLVALRWGVLRTLGIVTALGLVYRLVL